MKILFLSFPGKIIDDPVIHFPVEPLSAYVGIKYIQADKYVSIIETDMGNWMLMLSGKQDVVFDEEYINEESDFPAVFDYAYVEKYFGNQFTVYKKRVIIFGEQVNDKRKSNIRLSKYYEKDGNFKMIFQDGSIIELDVSDLNKQPR
ncbi:MAG: hypothetical protein KBH06_03265 [Spirochaetes bacterium]|nr:hypothetical protein [Spirochaetota bacterium]